MDDLRSIAGLFRPQAAIQDIQEFGNGNINQTYLVSTDADEDTLFILQRINTQVFRNPLLVMSNMRIATSHIQHRLQSAQLPAFRRWEMPRVLLTQDGSDHWIGPDRMFWRAVSFIRRAESLDVIQNDHHANEVGFALGMFHSLLNDLPTDRLADTLEGFHITPRYLERYEDVLAKHHAAVSPEMLRCMRFIDERRSLAPVLEDAKQQGRLIISPIHGDPKVNNILVDTDTGRAVSIVDLDTVKPGLVQYDIGDCLRSGCNPNGEETENWQDVFFDSDLCHAILKGYLPVAREFLAEDDFDFVFDSIRLIAFELGLRFFTDYLEGNVYFKVRHSEHNLLRALVQFRLVENIESKEKQIRSMVKDLR